MKRPTDVDEYIANAPQAVRPRLKRLRALIRKAAPAAHERISYGMPYYDYHGRLVYFLAAKNYIGLYIPTPLIAEHKDELGIYGPFGKATLHLPHDKKLPSTLITKLIKARMKKNEEAA